MSFGTFGGGSRGKFKPPRSELEREPEVQQMQPTDSVKRRELVEYYKNLMKKIRDKPDQVLAGIELRDGQKEAMLHAVAVELNRVMNGDVDSRINADFEHDFHEWLMGRSRYNANLDKTPWGAKRLCGDSIHAYLNQFVDKKFDLERAMTKLRMNIPQDIQTAWLFYKYVVRGMDPNGTEFLPEYEWLTSKSGQDAALAAEKVTGPVWDAEKRQRWDSLPVERTNVENAGVVPPRAPETTLTNPPETEAPVAEDKRLETEPVVVRPDPDSEDSDEEDDVEKENEGGGAPPQQPLLVNNPNPPPLPPPPFENPMPAKPPSPRRSNRIKTLAKAIPKK